MAGQQGTPDGGGKRYVAREIMSHSKSLRTIRKMLRTMTKTEIENVPLLVTERLDELEEAERLREELCSFIRGKGLNLKQAVSLISRTGVSTVTASGAALPPKYRFVDDNGVVHSWSGAGRAPAVFKKLSKEELEKYRVSGSDDEGEE